MGIDITGKQPRSEVGKHFQCGVGVWPHIYAYCRSICPGLIPKTYDTLKLDSVDCLELSSLLFGSNPPAGIRSSVFIFAAFVKDSGGFELE